MLCQCNHALWLDHTTVCEQRSSAFIAYQIFTYSWTQSTVVIGELAVLSKQRNFVAHAEISPSILIFRCCLTEGWSLLAQKQNLCHSFLMRQKGIITLKRIRSFTAHPAWKVLALEMSQLISKVYMPSTVPPTFIPRVALAIANKWTVHLANCCQLSYFFPFREMENMCWIYRVLLQNVVEIKERRMPKPFYGLFA